MKGRTRVSDDIMRFLTTSINVPKVSEADIKVLLDSYRMKFDLDIVYVCVAFLEKNIFHISHISASSEKYEMLLGENMQLPVEKYDLTTFLFDKDGLSEQKFSGFAGLYAKSALHFGACEYSECDGAIGYVDFRNERVWTQEERIALQQLGRIMETIIRIERMKLINDENIMMKKKQQKERERYTELVQALSSNYQSVFFADLDDNLMEPYQLSPEMIHDVGDVVHQICPFYEGFLDYANKIVIPDYRQEFIEKINIEFLKKYFLNKNIFTYDYVGEHDGVKNYYRMKFVKVGEHNSENVRKVVVGFANINEEVSRTRMHQQQMDEQLNIIKGLSHEYSSVYLVDWDTIQVKLFRTNQAYGDIIEALARNIDYPDIINEYAEQFVSPDDKKNFLKKMDISYVKKLLTKNPTHSVTFKRIYHDKIDHAQIIFNLVQNRDSSKTIVFAVRCIDNMVERELKQQVLLEDALEQAKAASKAKSKFLSSMSHDIRTPMNAIIGYTTLAAKHLDDRSEVEEYLEKAISSSNHLLSLINNILDMSRIESGRTQLHEAVGSINKSIKEVSDIIESQASNKKIQYIVSVDIRDENVYYDKLRMNQILLNLLGNAVKYTEPEGRVELSVKQIDNRLHSYASYEIKVSDTGIGMSEQFMEHIFEPFEREKREEVRAIQGTGLGLAITKNIVELADGKIEVKSEKNVGTEFTVYLDLKLAEKISPENSTKNSTFITKKILHQDILKNKTILLAEDNEINAEITMKLLLETGMNVQRVKNGEEAVQEFRKTKPYEYDLILMDIRMPVMDGYEATSRIRRLKREDAKKIPIVALSADAFEEDIKRSIKKGMNAHVSKPIIVQDLISTIIELICKKEN